MRLVERKTASRKTAEVIREQNLLAEERLWVKYYCYVGVKDRQVEAFRYRFTTISRFYNQKQYKHHHNALL